MLGVLALGMRPRSFGGSGNADDGNVALPLLR